MSINATSNYMSNSEILAWMETKTEGLYGHMRDAMDTANTRADAESALAEIKAAMANAKSNGSDAAAAHNAIDAALAKYKDIPEVVELLQPMAGKLDEQFSNAKTQADWAATQLKDLLAEPEPTNVFAKWEREGRVADLTARSTPAKIQLSSDDIDAWSKQIDDKVAALGKQDQLGLINIQEFNSQLNQAKQTASALMDSADKSASNIINHIA